MTETRSEVPKKTPCPDLLLKISDSLLKVFFPDGHKVDCYRLSKICELLENYVQKHHLLDCDNRLFINCKDDPLGKVLGVPGFYVPNEFLGLLKKHVTRVPDNCGNSSDPSAVSGATRMLYRVKPELLRVLSSVGLVDRPYRLIHILAALGRYVNGPPKLYDKADHSYVNVENDPLGEVFKVPRFHYTQAKPLLCKFLISCPLEKKVDEETTKETEGCLVVSPEVKAGCSYASNSRETTTSVAETTPGPSGCCQSISDAETVYSYQEYETASCQDSEDLVREEINESESDQVEYEIVSPSEDDDTVKEDPSSDVDMSVALAFAPLLSSSSGDEYFADDSDVEAGATVSGGLFRKLPSWKCVMCNCKNVLALPYCKKCWQVRKDWLPERRFRKGKRCHLRPKRRRDVVRSELGRCSSHDSAYSSSQHSVESSGKHSAVEEDDEDLLSAKRFCGSGKSLKDLEAEDSSEYVIDFFKFLSSKAGMSWLRSDDGYSWLLSDSFQAGYREYLSLQDFPERSIAGDPEKTPLPAVSFSKTCSICCIRPKNAAIIHGRTSHEATCYLCAKKLQDSGSGCPMCKRKIHMVTKHFIL